ncbi:hypothetical protein DENSPDRAFT_840754 [Dentipellis sp. KUC8613]|nr:hypothetical protein DENSPDRAFT_840754 [Dentipellis sp. KUC8613]
MNKVEKIEDVEASKAARLQRHQARYRDRGGIFKPAESNALLDILLSRDVTGKSPPKPRRGPRKSKATNKQRGREITAPPAPSRKARAPRKSAKKVTMISVDDEATPVPEDLPDVKGKGGRKSRAKKTKPKTSLPPDESKSDMKTGHGKSFAAQLADAINNGQAKKPVSKAKSKQGRRPPAPKPSTSRLPDETKATAMPQKAEIVLDDGDEDVVIGLHIKSKRPGADAQANMVSPHSNAPPSSSTAKSGRSTPALTASTARTTPQPDSKSDAGSSKGQKSKAQSKAKSGPSAPPARELSPIREEDESEELEPTRKMEPRASSVEVPLKQTATVKPPSRNHQKPKPKKRKQLDEDKDEAAKTVVKKRRKPSPVEDEDVVEVEVKPVKKQTAAQAKVRGKGKAARKVLSDMEEEDEEVIPVKKPRSARKEKEALEVEEGRNDDDRPDETHVINKTKGKKEASMRTKDDEVDSDDRKPAKKKRLREPEVEEIGNARAGKKTKATMAVEEDEDDIPLAPVAKNKPEPSTTRKEKELIKVAKETSKAPAVKPLPSPAKSLKPPPKAVKPASNRAKPSSRAKPPSRGPPPEVLKLLAANAKRSQAPVMEASEDDPIDFLS